MFWNNRTAFVTGATGFVGSHIARLLVEQGARVVCLQRDAVKANLKMHNLKVEFVPVTSQSRIPVLTGGNIDLQISQ